MEPTAVAFDFGANKTVDAVPLDGMRAAMGAGKFVWLDLDVTDAVQARAHLAAIGGAPLIAEELVEDALTREPATQTARYDDYLHVVVTGCRLTGDAFALERLDVVIGEQFLLTLHRGPVLFLDAVKKSYKQDFLRFAKSPSFLVYELWDHLIENYLGVQKQFETRVEKLQAELIGDVDDRVFARISEIGADLLHLRKIILPARSVLTDLSTRKSAFISEATQPFLGNMVGTLERVLQDLLVDKDILSESLDLHMSMVGHRTNRIMNRLTVVSVIFLPLTFLCGVYGMNFEVLPETKWEHGYLYFWGFAGGITVFLLWLMRRHKLL